MTSTPVVSGSSGSVSCSCDGATREQHREDLLEVTVDLLEGLEEAVAHLAVDGGDDLLQRRAAASRSSICAPMNSRRRPKRLELLHGDRVDRPEVGDLLAQPVGAVLGDCPVVERFGRERRLERHAEFLDDAAHRLVDLHLELALLDPQVAGRGVLLVDLGLDFPDRVLRAVDRLAQRLGVGLLEAGAVLELVRPVLGALLQHHVEVVDRLDALAQQLERLLGLAGRADGVLELAQLGVDRVDLTLEVDLALGDGRDLDLAGRQPLRRRALFAEARVALLARDRGRLLEALELLGGRDDARGEGLEAGAVLGGALADVGDAPLDALSLDVERGELLLEAADLLEQRVVLAGERRDLLRELERVLLRRAERLLGFARGRTRPRRRLRSARRPRRGAR